MTDTDAAAFWEQRYAESDRVWSGRANHTLAGLVADWPPGRALDLGSGEGGDAIWLARRGWHVTGVDIAATAAARASAAAAEVGVPADRLRWLVVDLASWVAGASPDGREPSRADQVDAELGSEYDLVTASFFQSWFEFPRAAILRRASRLVTSGGHLLVVSHAEPPPGADIPSEHHDHAPAGHETAGHETAGHETAGHEPAGHGHPDVVFPTPDSELADLALSETDWEVLIAEKRPRPEVGPDGRSTTLIDTVVLARRR